MENESTIDEATIAEWIAANFPGVDVSESNGDRFFIYDPERAFEGSMRIPFATLVTNDAYDKVSDLGREGVYRLNIGVTKATFRALFGEDAARPSGSGANPEALAGGEFDYTAPDVFMPHPDYGVMHWICILNPGAANFEKAKAFIKESYDIAVKRTAKLGGGA